MHGHGRKGVVRLVRDGKELRPIATIGACTIYRHDGIYTDIRAPIRLCIDIAMRIRLIDYSHRQWAQV